MCNTLQHFLYLCTNKNEIMDWKKIREQLKAESKRALDEKEFGRFMRVMETRRLVSNFYYTNKYQATKKRLGLCQFTAHQ
jgi:hypothetical protein